MRRRFYRLTRDTHLYLGLFLSPFVLLFAVSVFYLAHRRTPPPVWEPPRVVAGLQDFAPLEQMKGREQAEAARRLLDLLGVAGEINFIQRFPREQRVTVWVMLPGRNTKVDLDVEQRTASVSHSRTGTVDALIHLHKMPGPHNAAVRGNSAYMRVWRWLADATAYGVLFLTLSGVYLWAVLRAERRTGLVLLAAGAASFVGLVYVLVR